MSESTLRARVARAEELGYSPLKARLAVLDDLALRANRELDHVWRTVAPGRYRQVRVEEIQGFWREFWAVLRPCLESGHESGALEVLEKALARVEPAGPEAADAG